MKNYIKYAVVLLIVCIFCGCGQTNTKKEEQKAGQQQDEWKIADEIVKTVKDNAPEFADYEVSVVDFGAEIKIEKLSDSDADKQEESRLAIQNTQALKKAMEQVSAYEKDGKKGGTVIIPKGYFYTGAIHMESNIHLHLEDEANVMFATDYSQYPNVLTRWEGSFRGNMVP